MPAPTTNRLLPILGAIVVVCLVFATLKSCSESGQDGPMMVGVPQAPPPDADTPADTIKTLTANVAAMTGEVEALRRDNAALREENQRLAASRTQIEENVATRLRREFLAEQKDDANDARRQAQALESLKRRVDRLAGSLAEPSASGSDIPVGLGFDGPGQNVRGTPRVVWVEPLDQPEAADTGPGLFDRAGNTAGRYLGTAGDRPGETASGRDSRSGAAEPHPVYTVPRNATLLGSTVMTALVGRIPRDGQVRDPMPFKVITGAENLAANGLTVPGVHGMVWSGTAVGDWTLSCVTGHLESVTFVFDDGTIRTVSSDDRQGQDGRDEPLGWISDAHGIPCISGERKSNAAAFLSQRIGIQAAQAAAEAAAAAETTSVVSNAGGITDRVTGDLGDFVLGKTAAGGSEEVAKWLLERQSQSFDAVFVPAGTSVAIHVDRELAIDLDPQGRKLSHASAPSTDRSHRLD